MSERDNGNTLENNVQSSTDDVLKRLEKLGIVTTTYDHPPLFTVEDSKMLRGPIPGYHLKNLFLRGKKSQMWLIVCREDLVVQIINIKSRLGLSLIHI